MEKGYRSDSLITYAMQIASAGADARMAGADAPVVSNSGSGNQGIACTNAGGCGCQKAGCDR